MDIYKDILRPILFSFDSEFVHDQSLNMLYLYSKLSSPTKPISKDSLILSNLTFQNRVGLAAGFDKNALVFDVMSKFGFGHVEIGTVTPLPQSGNPKPRMFRIPKTNSLLNSIGFKSDGVKVIAKRLEKRKNFDVVIGGNIGKNKLTDNSKAANDYYICFKYLEDLVDYFTINISSPNTPGLRNLSDKELNSILEVVANENSKRFVPKPIFLKLSPDIDNLELERLVKLSEENAIDGLVLTNTTTNHQFRIGGMSGAVLNDPSHKLLKEVKGMTSKLKLISCGGIMNENIAKERFDSGADLIQLYTGLVYNGPRLIKDILR